MIISGLDFDNDGTNDLYIVQQQRALTADEFAALVKFVSLVLVSIVALAVLVGVGIIILDFTNWVSAKLAKWSRWDWWFWLTLLFVGMPTGLVLLRTYRPNPTFITFFMTGLPSITLAAIWSWSAAHWVIFSAVVLGVLTLIGGAYLIYREQSWHLMEDDAPSKQKKMEGNFSIVHCPGCQRKLIFPALSEGNRFRCPCCKSRLKIKPEYRSENFPQKVTAFVNDQALSESHSSMISNEFNLGDDEKFPWDDIEASRQDAKKQAKKNARWAQERYGSHAVCSKCNRTARDLAWFYFSSPDWTWEHLCGRAGWMAVCDHCHEQVLFDCDVMN